MDCDGCSPPGLSPLWGCRPGRIRPAISFSKICARTILQATFISSVEARDIARLPLGVDLAVLTVPAQSVAATLEDCMKRQVGSAIVFASGFAETGEDGRKTQEHLGELVRAGGMVVVGPNCLGCTNYAAGFSITFVGVNKVPVLVDGTDDAVAIVSQSGGLANHLRHGLNSRGVAVSYNISTGNEMDLGLGDFVDYLVDDAATRVIMIYAEDIRRPDMFLRAAARARAACKPLVMLFPGRSPHAREAAKSHTGALAGDYAVMKAKVERAGVHLVDTLDEFMDVAEILSRYPAPSRGGLGILTFSGAFCGIAHDFCADLGVEIPALSAATEGELRELLPSFISPKNPIDLGTEAVWKPELVGSGVSALLKEPSIGAVAISIPIVSPAHAKSYIEQIVAAKAGSPKPVAMAMLGDQLPLPQEFTDLARSNKVIVSRTSDRVLKALSRIVSQPPIVENDVPAVVSRQRPDLPHGVLPEWLGKALLQSEGIKIPQGKLVSDLDEALNVADAIGYPVVIKAQAAALAHSVQHGQRCTRISRRLSLASLSMVSWLKRCRLAGSSLSSEDGGIHVGGRWSLLVSAASWSRHYRTCALSPPMPRKKSSSPSWPN